VNQSILSVRNPPPCVPSIPTFPSSQTMAMREITPRQDRSSRMGSQTYHYLCGRARSIPLVEVVAKHNHHSSAHSWSGACSRETRVDCQVFRVNPSPLPASTPIASTPKSPHQEIRNHLMRYTICTNYPLDKRWAGIYKDNRMSETSEIPTNDNL